MELNDFYNQKNKERGSFPYELKLNGKTILAFSSSWDLSNVLMILSIIQNNVSYLYLNFLYKKFINDNLMGENSKIVEPTLKNPNFFKEIAQNKRYSQYSLPEDSLLIPLYKEEFGSPNWEIKKDIIMATFPIYLNEKGQIEKYPLTKYQKKRISEYLSKNPQMILLYINNLNDIVPLSFEEISFFVQEGKLHAREKESKGGGEVDLVPLFLLNNSQIYIIIKNLFKLYILAIKKKEIPFLGISPLSRVDPYVPFYQNSLEEGKKNYKSISQKQEISLLIIQKLINFLLTEGGKDGLSPQYRKSIIEIINFFFNIYEKILVYFTPKTKTEEELDGENGGRKYLKRIRSLVKGYKKISNFLYFYFLYPRIIWAKRTFICPYIRDKFFKKMDCFLCAKIVNGLNFTFLLFLGYNLEIKEALYIITGVFTYKIGKAIVFWIQSIWRSLTFYQYYSQTWMQRIWNWLVTPLTIVCNIGFIILCSMTLTLISPDLIFLCFQFAILLRDIGQRIKNSAPYQKYIIEKIWNKFPDLVSAIRNSKFFDPLF